MFELLKGVLMNSTLNFDLIATVLKDRVHFNYVTQEIQLHEP